MSKPPANKSRNAPTRHEPPPSIPTQIERSAFSGPLPPPSLLEEYDLIVPGAAERILQMAEAEAQFQREITLAALQTEAIEVRRGQILGFLLGTFALSTAGVALYLGYPDAASILGGTTLVGLVSVFVIGRVLDRPQAPNTTKSEKK